MKYVLMYKITNDALHNDMMNRSQTDVSLDEFGDLLCEEVVGPTMMDVSQDEFGDLLREEVAGPTMKLLEMLPANTPVTINVPVIYPVQSGKEPKKKVSFRRLK